MDNYQYLVEKYINHDSGIININGLSRESDLDLEIAKNSPIIHNWRLIFKFNYNITLDFIKENSGLSWNWKDISDWEDLNFEFVKKNITMTWNWNILSSRDKIDWKFVKNNSDLPWDWNVLSSREDLYFDFIRKSPDLMLRWNWEILSSHPNLNLDWQFLKDFESQLKWCWNWTTISNRHDLNWEFVKENPKLRWNWFAISNRTDVTMEFIVENKKMDWCKSILLNRLDFDIKIIFEWVDNSWNPELNTYCQKLDLNQQENLDIIINNPDIGWFWTAFKNNTNLSWDTRNKLNNLPSFKKSGYSTSAYPDFFNLKK